MEAFDDEGHGSGLEYLKTVHGARVTEAGELVSEWGVAVAFGRLSNHSCAVSVKVEPPETCSPKPGLPEVRAFGEPL